MMIGNLIKCEACGNELQPEKVLVGTNENGDLIRKCGFCGFEVNVEQEKNQNHS